MRRNIIGVVWLFGIGLALLLYRIGPDDVVRQFGSALFWVQMAFQDLLGAFAFNSYELMRALAVALFPVFVALCLLALHRGLQARRALVMVSVVFLLLLYGPIWAGERISSSRWMGAFLLVSIGSMVMTQRLLAPPSHGPQNGQARGPWPTRQV